MRCIKRSAATLLFLGTLTWSASATQGTDFLLVVVDDLGPDYLGIYSENQNAPPTPNIDVLAAQGVTFTNAYSNPICSPSRASIMTGLRTFNHGIRWLLSINGTIEMDLCHTTIPEALPSGYSATFVGKWHMNGSTWQGMAPIFQGFGAYAGSQGNFGSGDYFSWDKTVAVQGFVQTATTTKYATTDTADDAISSWSLMAGSPRLLVAAFNAPHIPYHVPPQNLHSQGSPSSKKGQMKAMVEALDTELGRLLAVVDLSTTLVILISDNGSAKAVSLHPSNKAKGTLYEGGIHVPMIVAGAGVDPSMVGTTCAELVGSVDIMPTIVAAAGGAPVSCDGRDLGPILAGQQWSPSPWVYSEVHDPAWGPPWTRARRALVDGTYKLIRDDLQGSDEFYEVGAGWLPGAPRLDGANLLLGILTPTESAAYQALIAEVEALTGGPF